ncbi:MAG: ribose-5-phosphate isomerase RpiA [Rhizobiales bacterium]|nr:ribose-5-phosphate isomerase RpiA [Hyphomicrobiales bacterium]
MTPDEQKQAAADAALDHIEDGMLLGLGTGSTAARFVDGLGRKISAGLNVLCVPTSKATETQASQLGIPLTTLAETPELDLTVDGADELDDKLSLIKGGGGALLREKIVATSSKRMIVIADASKHVETLGRFPLPVEVIPFGHGSTRLKIKAASSACGCQGDIVLRMRDGEPFVTDNANLIYDCHFGRIEDAGTLAQVLSSIAGVADHGLFIRTADLALIGRPGGLQTIKVDKWHE